MTQTLQLQINGNSITGTAQDMIALLQNFSEVPPKVKKKAKKTPPTPEKFEDFIFRQISSELGAELSQEIVKALEEIKNTEPDFRKFRLFYHKVATIEHRQLLKTISAAYRIFYARYHTNQYLSSLFSTIKYATACPHCGHMAGEFIIRLKQEGYFAD